MSSTVIAKNVQIGADGTASNNFTIFQPATPDGTLRIGNGNTGITSSAVALTSAGKFLLGTSSVVASSSATLQVAGSGTTASVTLARTDLPGSGNSFCGIDAYAFDGTASVVGGTINFRAAENWSSTNHGTDMQFRVTASGSGGALTETVRFTSAGNVGIGTSSPGEKLDVQGSSSPTIKVRNTANGIGNYSQIYLDVANSFSGTSASFVRSVSLNSGNSSTALAFGTNADGGGAPAERMRIDSSGNLLVGTTTALGKFTLSGGKAIVSSTDSGYGQLQVGNSSSGGEASIAFVSGATAFGSDPTSTNGNTYVWAVGAGVYGIGGNSWGVGNKGTGTYVAKIAHNSTSWTFSSDERLKDLDGQIENALVKVAGLRPVYYTWKNDETKKRKVGLIAQDVLAVLPEAVDIPEQETLDNGELNYLGLGMSDVVPLLVAAIQEQQAIITALTARVTALEGQP